MSLWVRPMKPADADAVALLEKACFSQPWSTEALAAALNDPHARFFIAQAADQIVGYIGCQFVCGEGSILNLAVLPAARRSQVASTLLTQLILSARQESVETLFLEVRCSNIPALKLYEKFGFVHCGRRPGFYSAPREDALLLKKVL